MVKIIVWQNIYVSYKNKLYTRANISKSIHEEH